MDLGVYIIMQTSGMNCWAASTAMLVGYRDSQSIPDSAIVDQMQQADPSNNYHDGATQVELANVARVFKLQQVYPVCQDANGWEQWLNDHGPLLIQIPGNAYHSIVISGVNPADAPPKIHVLDPWNGDRWIDFDTLNSEYEMAGTAWTNNVYATR
jgi:ABC-type bacteriocin/lantibiotic exporter with double-glycine peptidase domain